MDLFRYIDSHAEYFVAELKAYCAQPSIAAQNVGMVETVGLVRMYLERLGFAVRVFPLDGGYPVVYAERRGRSDKTLLFYQHYDVQPPDPLDEWTSPPFQPTVRDGCLFARGVSDNKGDTIARLMAIEAWLNVHGEIPLTVKFVIEGEEEIGSPHLKPFLHQHREMLRADYCIWEGGSSTIQGVPQITLGMKGMYYAELEVWGANQDVHSAKATIVPNPAWRLVWALASLKGPDERIRMDGFYDRVLWPTPQELEHLKTLPSNDDLKELLGLEQFVLGADGLEAVRRDRYEPTLNIDGFVAGYTGEGQKTVIGNWARVKIDFRLVADMNPDEVAVQLRSHLDRCGFGDVQIRTLSAARPYRVAMNAAEVKAVQAAVREVTGQEPVLVPTDRGSGPIWDMHQATGANPICVGVSYENSRFHAPDEHIVLDHFHRGIKVIAALMGRLGGLNS